MAEIQIYFYEDEEAAAEQFSFWQTADGFSALMIGPTKILPPVGAQLTGLDLSKDFFVVVGGSADAVADPSILSPPPPGQD
jgi:hypothetical protein